MKRIVSLSAFLALVIVLGSACGGGGGGSVGAMPTPIGTEPPGGSWAPLKVGNSWVYDVTDSTNGNSTKTVSVADISNVGDGIHSGAGYRLHTVDTVSGTQDEWHVDLGSVIQRERRKDFDPAGAPKTDASYIPSKLYIDQTAAHTALNATWTENYSDKTADLVAGTTTTTDHVVTWTVDSISDPVTTPAGSLNCLKLHRVATSSTSTGTSDKYFWFAQGIGKVQEQDVQGGSPIHTETLKSYSVTP